MLLGSIVFVVAVHAYRWYFIHGRDRRRREVRRFLPHAMDTVAMVMSSGDPFAVSLDAVIRDFPDEPLSQELAVMQNNLKRGQTMDAALANLSDTICLPEFREMVRVLSRIQDHGGAGAADFTRLARQLRIAQLRYMEEEVGKAEASMEIPVILVMFSAMLVSVAPFLLALMQSDLMK